MHMLDTNICIYVLKNHSAALRRKFRDCGDLCISVVTWAELCFGVENGTPALRESRWVQLDAFTRLLPVLAMDEPVGVCYGRVRAHLKKEGTPIGNNDLFIAAHALSLGATLVTNNQREFNRVPDLVVENWV